MSILITGGAGFIGANLARRLLRRGETVCILDSLARAGSEKNLRWLESQVRGQRLRVTVGDVRDINALRAAMRDAQHVYHFAAQVAVTASLRDPQQDFSVNAQGTLNVLEVARSLPHPPSVLFASTNKVYGALDGLALNTGQHRYVPRERKLRIGGIDELQALQFHSPYGCSKGAAEQYVLDYARSFGLRAVVLRMSCIYGPHQYGTEDQGWVAHFIRRALGGQPLTIYGDGKQVRDVLYVEDFMDALERTRAGMERLSGRVFNIGGGPGRTLSLLELVQYLSRMIGKPLGVQFAPWRQGDQKYYVSDITRFAQSTGWHPRTGLGSGLGAVYEWMQEQVAPPKPAAPRQAMQPAASGAAEGATP